MNNAVFILMTLLHKLAVFSGLVTAWYGCDFLVKTCMHRKWFVWLSAFSFIIYALHVPLLTYLINPVLQFASGLPHARLLVFILLPLGITAFCITTGVIMRRLIPGIYGLLTGGRGF